MKAERFDTCEWQGSRDSDSCQCTSNNARDEKRDILQHHCVACMYTCQDTLVISGTLAWEGSTQARNVPCRLSSFPLTLHQWDKGPYSSVL